MISNGQPSNEFPAPLPSAEKGRGSIAGKVVLIIGGVGDMGRTLAAELAEQGAHVALVYRRQAAEEAHATKRQVEAHQRECLLIPATPEDDKRKFARRVVKHVVDTLGRLDIFIDYSSAADTGEPHATNGDEASGSRDVFPGIGMLVAAMNQIAEQT
ncbi:MAG: SDR family NAD(P)-dependent oxidoreductase [Anaerolineales bacterium]|nr:SDR family NAD(P)-dependent oxidoreductase [Anaerolineales bacterium]